jgi:hypothetical protein
MRGCHSAYLAAVDLTWRRFRLDNSWGPDWGIRGSAWVSFETVTFWLANQSDFALPRRDAVVRASPRRRVKTRYLNRSILELPVHTADTRNHQVPHRH